MPQTVAAVSDISARGYARPEVLVSTQWVEEHRNDPKVRLLESNEDVLLYETGHIPGAVKIDWVTDLNDPLVRDYVDRARFERLLRAKGINNDTTIVFYGDKNNWWATYAFWPAEELRTIYEAENGLGANDDVVAYCRIGERSSHTWFALTYLLGFKNVRNYDGSWTEWGNTVKAPIEKP